MTGTQAVDSAGRHTDRSAAALAERGIVGALRYRYNTDADEVAVLHRHGLAFGLIYERAGNAAVSNPELGDDHARDAVAFARSIGLPAGCAIYYAEADTYVARSQYGKARRYWELAAGPTREAGYRCGAYGGSVLIDWLVAEGVVDLTWRTAASSWNEYRDSDTAALVQLLGQPTIGGVTVDLNDVRREDWGQWVPEGAPRPDIITPPTGDVTDDQEEVELMGVMDEVRAEFVNQDTRTRAYVDAALAAKDERDKAFVTALVAKVAKAIGGDEALGRLRDELGVEDTDGDGGPG